VFSYQFTICADLHKCITKSISEGTVLLRNFVLVCVLMPIEVALRSKAWVCGRSLVAIVGSNPAGVMDASLVSVVR
jgi:hypothetical protein